MKTDCEALVTAALPDGYPSGYAVARLTGDASTRSYFRIRTPKDETLILMLMPEPFNINRFPYLDRYHLMRNLGIDLAEVYRVEPERGYVFLQDLGDATYYELYESWNEQQRLHHYLEAINAMLKIEKGHPADNLSFDTEKFLWELHYFKKHFLFGLRNITLSAEEDAGLEEQFVKLATELSERPRVFCHRDYHSRNLMIHNDRMFVIDFQDSRFGPATYDLASLLYDSYIQLPERTIRHLEDYFFLHHPDAKIQRFEYPRMCLQRNLKALGTFGYQAIQMGREFYVQFVRPTLGYVRKHLESVPEYRELGRILKTHLPELQ
ncbi:MAG TPA: phosphotransferase [Acidobacteriota bacterium]|nr:phosphotransferase [Acidobacteriota bacterium]